MERLLGSIVQRAEMLDLGAIRDGLGWINERYDREGLKRILRSCAEGLRKTKKEEYYEYYRLGLLVGSPREFDCYMQYLEIDRKPEKRFYMPRRRQLLRLVNAMQSLEEGSLDELFIHLPPRVGKSTLSMMYLTWLMGKDPERSNLYCSYSDTITKSFYNGLLEILTDEETYHFGQIFPESPIVRQNAQDETIDLRRAKHFPSLTARSLLGTLNGACDCSGLLIADDLCSGIEEALNKDRLIATWAKVDNNMLPRAKESAKLLWIGTRWSVIDPPGLRLDALINDEAFSERRYRVISTPALNDLDESNFEYEYGVGFSTRYFRERRASFERRGDTASWFAQYQNVPIEREGAVIAPNELMYYNGELPKETPDRVYMAVDPAWGGGDYVAAPVVYQYGDMLYIHDVVYDNRDKSKTVPAVADRAFVNNVTAMYVEATKTTETYADEIDSALRSKKRRVNIVKSTANIANKAKNDRIQAAAPDIRTHMVFRENGKRSAEYERFMQNVFSFKFVGKNKNDDAPDSLQMAIKFGLDNAKPVARIGYRPF